MKTKLLIIAAAFLLQGCTGTSYKSDFGCKTPKKPGCISLYEVTLAADRGEFGPDSKKKSTDNCKKCSPRKRRVANAS